jgi:hypothetical protein
MNVYQGWVSRGSAHATRGQDHQERTRPTVEEIELSHSGGGRLVGKDDDEAGVVALRRKGMKKRAVERR